MEGDEGGEPVHVQGGICVQSRGLIDTRLSPRQQLRPGLGKGLHEPTSTCSSGYFAQAERRPQGLISDFQFLKERGDESGFQIDVRDGACH